MNAQFAKEFHGSIWFTYAQIIRARPARDAEGKNEENQREIKRINDQKRMEVYQRMQDYVNETKNKNKTLAKRL